MHVRRFSDADSAAAASDFAPVDEERQRRIYSRQSRHATPRPRPPKAAPPNTARQRRSPTPRPRPPKAAPPTLSPKASVPDSPAAPSNAAASAAAASDFAPVDEGTPATPMPPRPAPKAEPPTALQRWLTTADPKASAPQVVSASAPKAASASAPDSPAEPSDDLVARMEAAAARMEAAARRVEAARGGKGGGKKGHGRAWHDKKRQRAEMHRAGQLPPRTTQTPMCRHCGRNQPSQYCRNNACRTCCEAGVGDACVYHDVG